MSKDRIGNIMIFECLGCGYYVSDENPYINMECTNLRLGHDIDGIDIVDNPIGALCIACRNKCEHRPMIVERSDYRKVLLDRVNNQKNRRTKIQMFLSYTKQFDFPTSVIEIIKILAKINLS